MASPEQLKIWKNKQPRPNWKGSSRVSSFELPPSEACSRSFGSWKKDDGWLNLIASSWRHRIKSRICIHLCNARESPGFGEAGLRAARKLRYEVQKPPAKGRKQASAANTCCHIEAS
ncbi:predicted protein [Histoplasma capsulatum G186AR]|uniref:Uncharacterized protein n=1 Tax=Ajellomyces capsulatus (strain G186AR / H82 / ATCC MYA-2454 / RMSCC 2432) TaxID=447093 RepID=C0NLS0_AJECG|nr:uncharacterized protein HCBG_04450 [Histoplasma capsulatum G186AR]EEH07571.1 predicted protein [Histoplasma capsulatum G186AR]